MGIALHLQIVIGKIGIFPMLILPTEEHGRTFHFLVSSKISSSNIKISCHTSLPLVWLVTLRYFMLFAAIVKGVDFLIHSPAFLSHIYKRSTDFF